MDEKQDKVNINTADKENIVVIDKNEDNIYSQTESTVDSEEDDMDKSNKNFEFDPKTGDWEDYIERFECHVAAKGI